MTENKYFTSLSLGANCSQEEIDLINETYEEVTGFNESVTFRRYLFTLLAKATTNVRPNNSKKEDVEKISVLTNEINDAKQKHIDIIKIKDDKINELLNEIEEFKISTLQQTTNESEVLKEKDVKIDELLLEVENLNNALYEASESEGVLKKEKNDKIKELILERDSLNQTIKQLSSKEPEKIEVHIPVKLTDTQNIINLTPMEKYFMDTVCYRESKRTGRIISSEIILKDIFNRYIAYGPCDYFPRPFSDSELKELHTKFNPKLV